MNIHKAYCKKRVSGAGGEPISTAATLGREEASRVLLIDRLEYQNITAGRENPVCTK